MTYIQIRAWILMAALFLAITAFFVVEFVRPLFIPNSKMMLVRIPAGSSAGRIANLLEEKEVLGSSAFFLFLTVVSGKSNHLQHGTYLLEKGNYWNAIVKLEKGWIESVKVTIPEGWSSFQIAERLKNTGVIANPDAFIQLVANEKYEGMLFPNTYHFEVNLEAEKIIERMIHQFHAHYPPKFSQRAEELRFSQNEVLTLASIIEREAQIDSERASISSVYHNRLRKGIRLEADPTIQYALSGGRGWKEKLYYKDLEVDSPYNTYRYRGLPPGPICNPGEKSIEAALFPADTSYLFFVADGKGGHHFFTNYREHLKKQLKKS